MTVNKIQMLLSIVRRALIMIVKALEECLDVPEGKRFRKPKD